MITAIVLLKADVARIPETAEIIAQIPQVTEVYSVTGEFDLVALIRVRAHEELADVIPGTLNRVEGVTHTETHIAFRTYSRHDLEAAFSGGPVGGKLSLPPSSQVQALAFTRSANIVHVPAGKASSGPSGSLLSRTATAGPVVATSMQVPPLSPL